MSDSAMPTLRPKTGWTLMRWLLMSALVVVVLGVIAAIVTRAARRAAVGEDTWEALEIMSVARAPATGSNGFADLYLAQWHVPADRAAEAFAAELVFREAVAPDGEARPGVEVPPRLLDTAYMPRRAELATAPGCPLSSCLDHVRTHADETRSVLAAEAEPVAAAERAAAAGHLRNPFPPGADQPQPPYPYFRLLLADAALDAVDGRVPRSYARTCRLLASMRRVSVDPDDLIAKMVALAYARAAATQLLALRRHYPVARLPADCAEAVAPVRTGEALVCDAMRGEFRRVSAEAAAQEERLARLRPDRQLLQRLLWDPELQRAWAAVDFVENCASEGEALAARGLPPPAPARTVRSGQPDCVLAYGTCVGVSIAVPRYRDYALRALDETLRVRLLLAGHAVADGTATAREAVAASALEGDRVRFDDRGDTATVTLLAPTDGAGDIVVDFSGLAPAAR